MHISRISRENEKWFCETFLARNAAREIARKIGQFLAILDPNLAKFLTIYNAELLKLSLKYYTILYRMTLWTFRTSNHVTNYNFSKCYESYSSKFEKFGGIDGLVLFLVSRVVKMLENYSNGGQREPQMGLKWYILFLAIYREKWVSFSRISREIKNARNVQV